MRTNRYQSRGQLVLELERRGSPAPLAASPKGLIEALADLLLEVVTGEATTRKGGGDERQDHA